MIKIEFSMPKLQDKFKNHRREMLLVLAAAMQTNRAMMFDKDGADNGKQKWPDPMFRKGRPLQKTGALRKSMAPNNDGITPGHGTDGVMKVSTDEVTIGTKLLYARLMNDGTTKMPGGILRPVHAKALKIPIPGGKGATDVAKEIRKSAHGKGNEKFIFRKSVRIPKREMDTVTEEDKREWSNTLANFIVETLNGGD